MILPVWAGPAGAGSSAVASPTCVMFGRLVDLWRASDKTVYLCSTWLSSFSSLAWTFHMAISKFQVSACISYCPIGWGKIMTKSRLRGREIESNPWWEKLQTSHYKEMSMQEWEAHEDSFAIIFQVLCFQIFMFPFYRIIGNRREKSKEVGTLKQSK